MAAREPTSPTGATNAIGRSASGLPRTPPTSPARAVRGNSSAKSTSEGLISSSIMTASNPRREPVSSKPSHSCSTRHCAATTLFQKSRTNLIPEPSPGSGDALAASKFPWNPKQRGDGDVGGTAASTKLKYPPSRKQPEETVPGLGSYSGL